MFRHRATDHLAILASILVVPATVATALADDPKPVAKPAQSAPIGIPKPTVVLKPGEMPAATFEMPVHDFGRIQADTELVYDFKFKNTGTGPLEILRVKPGCGCTTAGEYTRIVKPGESGTIPIKFKPGSRGGPTSKQIEVNTNIPGIGATIRLEIKGLVWVPVQVTPPSAAFGRLTVEKIDSGITRNLTLVNNTDGTMKIGTVVASNPTFHAEIKPVEDGKKYELIVSLVDPVTSGNNAGTITIETGLDDPATITIPAYAFLAPPVDITPSQLVLESPRIEEMKRQFYVRSNSANPIDVTDVKASTDALKLEVSDVRGDRRTYRIGVTIPADYTPPPQGHEITFKTSDPAMPVGHIPVTVITIHDKDDLPKMKEIETPADGS